MGFKPARETSFLLVIAEEFEYEIAMPADMRALIGLKGLENVGY